MKLYDYPASANCYKVRLALAQLHRPYDRVTTDIFAGETLTPAFAALNPSRTTPVLELDDGRVLVESGAMLVFLAQDSPLLPADPVQRAEAIGWLIYEQTDVIPTMGGLRFRLHTGRLAADAPAARARHAASLDVLERLEGHLARRAFFVGDSYSIADIALYGYVHVAHEAGIEMERFAAVQRWLAAVRDQPDHVDDLRPYPDNARAGVSRSIYD
jgi:glutathione S-transferase